jgi:FkbM family methyltransferase
LSGGPEMTFASYAQNCEDVLLWRALRHVDAGTFVDVGAGHPTYHSVTRAFSDAGWSGINIEPLPYLADALRSARPRDTTIHAAVSSATDDVVLTVVLDWDELSSIDPRRTADLNKDGRRLEEIRVPTVRLDDAITAAGLKEIHFLKIDVEGAELDVLSTIDLTAIRPWVVVVEVAAADGERHDRETIRNRFVAARYLPVYHDGLNDFFLADEHSDLRTAFDVPVNVTDGFVQVSAGDHVALDRIGRLLGLSVPVDSDEVFQRVSMLRADRIAFENRLKDQSREFDVERARLETEIDEQAQLRDLAEASLQAKDRTLAALELSAFARERLIAAYASGLERANLRVRELEAEGTTLRAVADERDAELAELRRRSELVLGSLSWRVTRPARVLLRPAVYARALRDRW